MLGTSKRELHTFIRETTPLPLAARKALAEGLQDTPQVRSVLAQIAVEGTTADAVAAVTILAVIAEPVSKAMVRCMSYLLQNANDTAVRVCALGVLMRAVMDGSEKARGVVRDYASADLPHRREEYRIASAMFEATAAVDIGLLL